MNNLQKENTIMELVYMHEYSRRCTFNYVAINSVLLDSKPSCADLDILRRTRNYKNGFSIIDYNNLLYPQYWDDEHFPSKEQLLEKNKEQLAKAAKKKLRESNGSVHPNVKKHWEMVASLSK
ncbi:MAG: hypothetical protein IPJ03_16800 [Ignavibacteriales bacterium]|nr:hypothetical protein [Ignavibacteriales bacterium]